MSVSHPIIAVTGSSGAGTSTVKHAFEDIFRRGGIKPVIVENKIGGAIRARNNGQICFPLFQNQLALLESERVD